MSVLLFSLADFFSSFVVNIKNATLLEYIAVISGIASVWLNQRENVWVYPTGLIGTVIYTWLSFNYHLPGEAAVNFYYTVMSIYGWWLWLKKDDRQQTVLHITFSNRRMWAYQLLFFAICYAAIFLSLLYLKPLFFEGAIPWADALASASAFTGMWLMTQKKVESWYWWILTDFVSIPLYGVKGLALTGVYYFILFVMAIAGLLAWQKRARQQRLTLVDDLLKTP